MRGREVTTAQEEGDDQEFVIREIERKATYM